jgi:L-aminopeptidase/D-esterase-like protein
LTKAEISKVAQMAHDGLALAIRPAHTPFDGDAIFALSTGHGNVPTAPAGAIMVSMVGTLAAQTLARALVKAARAATGLHGIPGLSDLNA